MKNRQRIFEILCVAALVVFIALVSMDSFYSDKTAEEVAESVTKSFDVSELKEIKMNKTKEEFGIDFVGVDSFVYYASDSVMNVSELMIIKLEQDVKPDEIKEKISSRLSNKQNLFAGYAPEQSALLDAAVLTDDSGLIFYCVGENAAEALASFKSNVR